MSLPICDDAAPWRVPARRRRLLGPLVATLAIFVLVGCEREATGAPDAGPAPLTPHAAELSGAPAAPSAPPPMAEAPPSAVYVPPEAPTAASPPPASSGVVAMEPIPNPPEPAHRVRMPSASSMRVYAPRDADSRRRRRSAATSVAPTVATVHVRGPQRASKLAPVTAPRPAVVERPPLSNPSTAAATPAPGDDRGARLAALQGALAGAVQTSAKLDVPSDRSPDRPSDVTLTLPAEFADAVRREAGRQGLSEAAASVSLSARLSGDGFTAMPDDAQMQPLQSDHPTRFHWTIISQAGARGPLHADLSAQLLGGGADSLDLGVVKPQAQNVEGWRALGVGMLLLAFLAAVAWLGRSRRRRPTPDVRPSRPLDMSDGRRL